MCKHLGISLFQVSIVANPVGFYAPISGQRRLRARPLAWVVFAFLAATQFLSASHPARAQEQSINVLIDSSFQGPAALFLEELRGTLAPEARKAVRFVPKVIPTSNIPAYLNEKPWEMAILSTLALTKMSSRSAAIAFEMPFVFPTMRSIIEVQQSPIGQAGLSTMSEQGMTGLVYLNAGATLVAGRGRLNSPDDLKGRIVAVDSQAQFLSLQKIGISPVALTRGDVQPALMTGRIDSTVISSGIPNTWELPKGGFLLTDSVKAQVAVVVTHNATWDRIPFIYRAMIGDAAIAVSFRFDRSLQKTEDKLFGIANSSGLSLVKFLADDASRATRQWISNQPEAMHGIFTSVYDRLRKTKLRNPRNPLIPGRRGQVGQLYFATTRDDTGHRKFAYRFDDTRTNIVKCGQINYSPIDPIMTNATFVGAVTAGNTACGTYLNAVLQSSKRMLIFVHGFNNRFSEAAERGMMLKNKLGDDVEVVLWSWPSKRDGLGGNYKYDKESAAGVARQRFERLLKALKVGSDSASLNILAHSMGGWHTIGVLQGLSDDNASPTLKNVVLAAPDVPSDEFRFALDDMRRVANRITLYASEWDWALMISEAWNDYARAGTGGHKDIVVSDKLESIDVDSRLFSKNHSYVFEVDNVLNDLTGLVLTDIDASGRGLLLKPKARWHYWALR